MAKLGSQGLESFMDSRQASRGQNTSARVSNVVQAELSVSALPRHVQGL